MFRPHEAVAQPPRVPDGQLDHPLGPGGEPLHRGPGGPLPRVFDQQLREPGVGHAAPAEDSCPLARLLPYNAQEQVLAADVAVAQLLRRLLGLFKGGFRPLGESVVAVHVYVSSSSRGFSFRRGHYTRNPPDETVEMRLCPYLPDAGKKASAVLSKAAGYAKIIFYGRCGRVSSGGGL